MTVGVLVSVAKTIPCMCWHFTRDSDTCSFYPVASFIWVVLLSGEVFVLVVASLKRRYHEKDGIDDGLHEDHP